MNNKKTLNNKGFSLLELIIVFAVVLIIIGFVGITIATTNGANVNKAAKNLQSSFVQSRVQSMAKGGLKGQIKVWTKDGGGVLCKIGEDGATEELCNKQITAYLVNFNPTTKAVSLQTPLPVASESTATAFFFNNIGGLDKTQGWGMNGFNGIMFQRKSRQTIVSIFPESGKISVTTL